MTVESSNPALASGPERRQAMWPWLVMPLATLTLFCALHEVRIQPSSGSTDSGSSRVNADDSAP